MQLFLQDKCGRETDHSVIPPVRTRRAQLMQRAQDSTLLLLTFKISDEQFELWVKD